MKKIAILVALVLLVAVPAAFSQFRVDIGFNAPISIGFSGFDIDGESVDVPSFIPLPFAQLSYGFDLGPVNLGIGLKAYTLIIESLAWPTLFVELDVDPVIITASVGGGLFIYFGAIGNGTLDTHMFIPDLAAHLKLGRVARFGLGVMTFVASEEQELFPYIFYGSLQFSFPL
ncbi:MAG TPA: hypothetical protein DCG47_02375 [Spirochaetaceae bacterium]|jgi:hypothetical protein|nr:hypothetical protein [Spirochaetaceae bacterium]